MFLSCCNGHVVSAESELPQSDDDQLVIEPVCTFAHWCYVLRLSTVCVVTVPVLWKEKTEKRKKEVYEKSHVESCRYPEKRIRRREDSAQRGWQWLLMKNQPRQRQPFRRFSLTNEKLVQKRAPFSHPAFFFFPACSGLLFISHCGDTSKSTLPTGTLL